MIFQNLKQLFISNKFPIFLQTDRFDCGPSCLKMLTKFYGKNFSIEHLRYLCNISPDGISAKNLIEASEELGFHAMPATINFKTLLEEAPIPCVVSWEDSHFVVVYKVLSKRVYIADPAFGLITYSKEEFKEKWLNIKRINDKDEGLVILLEPSAKFYTQEENEIKSGLKTILPFLNNYNKYLIQVFVGLLVGIIVQLALPFITQSLVDKGINYQDINFIYVLLIAQLTLFLSSSLINVFRSWLLLFIGARVSMLITSE